jgi:hypothetical protein
VEIVRPRMSAEQQAMIDDPHRILWVGTGTKTGKTVALAQWDIEGVARGERCAWVGPYYKRTRTGFEHIAGAFEAAARAGLCRIRENEMRLDFPATGGVLECFSGDNPQSIYGERFHRVVVDEASRQPAGVLPAVMSTTTATMGKVRIVFNLDRGRSHWAISGFLNARAGADPSHGYVFLTTEQSPYVTREAIEDARRTLPDAVFRALYLGEIQEDGAGVFRNVEALHAGATEGPGAGPYVIGADLARKNDWTVAVVFDQTARRVVEMERFHNVPWNEACNRIAALSKRYKQALVVPDATGVGDVVVESLRERDVRLMPIVITGGRSVTDVGTPKAMLIQHLMVEAENRGFTFPASLEVLTNELKAFEYDTTAAGQVTSGSPDGMHDDAVIALALALWGARYPALTSDSIVLGQADLVGAEWMGL